VDKLLIFLFQPILDINQQSMTCSLTLNGWVHQAHNATTEVSNDFFSWSEKSSG
jgi:predicted signal transduction protein with EAL and GGDEF domain